ncbi:MAG TPA: aldolase/citrate lyase family protein [Longimicrobium sp.]|nr:aldolase/citrate lyase family protein [Longimicrobium sp.]
MIKNFREALRRGTPLNGVLVTMPSPEVVEILSTAGFDWLFFDLEHSPTTFQDLQNLIRIASPRCFCAVRVPENNPVYISRALDVGAEGVILPRISSAAEAQQAVAWSKYPPRGTRGIGVGRAQSYGRELEEYLRHANDYIAVILQIEDAEGARNAREIARVEGVDALFVGPYDLSASLGVTGQVGHPSVQDAIAQVASCRSGDTAVGIFSLDPAALRARAEAGFTLLACGVDTTLLAQGAKIVLDELKPA